MASSRSISTCREWRTVQRKSYMYVPARQSGHVIDSKSGRRRGCSKHDSATVQYETCTGMRDWP